MRSKNGVKYLSTRWSEYLRIGVQYYISGRFANLCSLSPVAGNLFHHGIEMLIKGRLLYKESAYTPEELYEKFGHNLPKLWEEYKRTTDKQSLSKFDATVKDIHRWEEIRYPNYKNGDSVSLITSVMPKQKWEEDRKIQGNVYEIHLADVDELFQEIIKSWPLNPSSIKFMLQGVPPGINMTISVYLDQNAHPLF